MPPIKGKVFDYTEETMEKAIEEAKSGKSINATAKKYNVPYSTLSYKVNGKTTLKRGRLGPKPFLSNEQEDIIVFWVLNMVKAGFPVSVQQLQDSICKLVSDLKIQTPFKDNRPGRHWFEGFQRRHPEIKLRTAQNLTETRAGVTKEALSKWFTEVEEFFTENNLENVITCGQRVFNCDESAFFLNPKGNKVLAAKGTKTIYQRVNADEKECLTVLVTGNAAGDVPPPMIVFQYERIPRDLALSVPENWGIGRSDSGWMTGETFYEYIANVFNPWLLEKDIPKPVILFIDGHLTLHTSKFCSDNGIVLIALYPNATHLIQPMDVAVFRSLKSAWKTGVHDWRLQNIENPKLRKVHFAPLLKTVLDKTLKASLFENGFRTCGLCPWNLDAVIRQTPDNKKPEETITNSKELKDGLAFIEKQIGEERLSLFKSENLWTGDIKETSLFELWKSTREQLYEAQKTEINRKQQNNKMIDDGMNDNILNNKDEDNDEIRSIQEADSIILKASEALLSPTIQTENFLNSSEVSKVLTSLSKDEINPCTPTKDSSIDRNSTALGYHKNTQIKLTTNTTPTDTFEKTSDQGSDKNIILYKMHEPVASTSAAGPSVPTPFKRLFFWPKDKVNPSKKRRTERIPAVVTSKKWQEYHENKEKKKSELLEQKQKRAQERLIKKKEKEEVIKQKQEKNMMKKNTAKPTQAGVEIYKRTLFDSSDSETNIMERYVRTHTNKLGNNKNIPKRKFQKKLGKQNKMLLESSESENEVWQPSGGSTDDLASDDEDTIS